MRSQRRSVPGPRLYQTSQEAVCAPASMRRYMLAVGSYQLDLSKNRFISGSSPFPDVMHFLHRESADEHFAAAAEMVIEPRLRENLLRELTSVHLLELFKSGVRELVRDYPIRGVAGSIVWIRSTLRMRRSVACTYFT